MIVQLHDFAGLPQFVGPSILGRVTMPITEDIKGVFRLDYRYRRGVAVGFDRT